jgi:HlyD family secretion protein
VSTRRVRIGIGVVVVIAAALIVWRLVRAGGSTDGRILASGTVEATRSDVGFASSGRIASVLVQEGDVVTAGQVLARLEGEELEARRAGAEAQGAGARAQLAELRQGPRAEEIAQARATVAAAESRRADAQRDAERARRLFAGGAISREALDKAETQLTVAEAQRAQAGEALLALERGTRAERIAGAEAQVRQTEAALAQVDALLGNAVATAPFDGLVTVRHREPGETVAAGVPIVSVMNPADRWVRIYIPQSAVSRISIGRNAEISVDGYPGEVWTGRVAHIASEAEFTPRNVQTPEERTRLVYAVRVRIEDDPALHLKPGLPVDVRIAPEPLSRAASTAPR